MGMRCIRVWVVVTLAALITGCASLPTPQGRIETTALTDTADTRLGRAVTPGVGANPGKTGIQPLPNPQDAFAARILLAGASEKSIDAQYFLWHGDQVGNLMFEALWHAAGRGVRVRLLIDESTRPVSTLPWRRSTRIRISRCACTTRSSSATPGGSIS